MSQYNRSRLVIACRIIGWQMLCLLVVSSLLAIYNFSVGMSLLMGGMVTIFPTLLFAIIFLKQWRSLTSTQIIKRFYLGELFKMLLTGLLAVVCIITLTVNLLAFMFGLLVAYLSFLVMAIFFYKQ